MSKEKSERDKLIDELEREPEKPKLKQFIDEYETICLKYKYHIRCNFYCGQGFARLGEHDISEFKEHIQEMKDEASQ